MHANIETQPASDPLAHAWDHITHAWGQLVCEMGIMPDVCVPSHGMMGSRLQGSLEVHCVGAPAVSCSRLTSQDAGGDAELEYARA